MVALTTAGAVSVSSAGLPSFQVGRVVEGSYLQILEADATGEVGSAILMLFSGKEWSQLGCRVQIDGATHNTINEGMYVLDVEGDDMFSLPQSPHTGAIGAAINDLHPVVLQHDPDAGEISWVVSKKWVARFAPGFVLTAHPWDMSDEHFVTSPATDPEADRAVQLTLSGDAIFWETGDLYRQGLNVWDSTSGTRPFIRWIGDGTRGAANLGTDGKDMVWSEGEGKLPSEKDYPVRSVMTAPFTTDPQVVAQTKRRLRSQPSKVAQVYPWEVGCGYAVFDAGSFNTVLVVRLSDGWSWTIPNTATQVLARYLGVDCTYAYVSGSFADGAYDIARIRLDSLGPGMPPD